MGLMNVGRSEGSEIIQLFSRVVRLKASVLKGTLYIKDNPSVKVPQYISILETLNIFGVRALHEAVQGIPGGEGFLR